MVRRVGRWLAIGLIAACGGGVGHSPPPDGAGDSFRASEPETRRSTRLQDAPASPDAGSDTGREAEDHEGAGASHPVTVVTDPDALRVVRDAGASFGAVVGGPDHADATNDVLRRKTRYGAIAAVLTRDVRSVGRSDRHAGVGIRGNPHRLFDVRWLRSSQARFELVGVVNRLDRRPFTPKRCGEARLVYRLAYRAHVAGQLVRSRLPMTLVVALRGDSPDATGCRRAARRWLAPADIEGRALGRWLVSRDGPLDPERLAPARVTRVEINLQRVRWPSAVRPDLGGHAEYLMRVFRVDGDAPDAELSVAPLLDTPDVERLRRDASLRRELAAWIRDEETLARIDAGTAVLPERFAADKAVTVTPRGPSRRANRPFAQLFEARDFRNLSFEGRRFSRSASALLRRLDDMTCTGCHGTRSIAGFHLLGEDSEDAAPGNALAVPISVHLRAEARRRAALTSALAREGQPDWARPFAGRAEPGPGDYGDPCGLGDPGFSSWRCGGGLRCDRYDAPPDAPVGVCLPVSPQVGDPCEVGPMQPHRDPHRDRVREVSTRDCPPAGACNSNRVGFPGGMCTVSCDSGSERATCGVIAQLRPFNNCLAQNRPFPDCLQRHVFRAGVRRCSAERPCREDYVCARSPQGGGACIPPYFLFQLRVDGHP